MSERALISIFTCTSFLPELADFGLKFHLESFDWFVLNFSCVTLNIGLLLLQFLLFLSTRLFLFQITALFEVLHRCWCLKVIELLLPLLGFLFRIEIFLSWVIFRMLLVHLLHLYSSWHLWPKSRLKGWCLWIKIERLRSNILGWPWHLGYILRTCIWVNIEVRRRIRVDLCLVHWDLWCERRNLWMEPDPFILIFLFEVTWIIV